MKAANAGDHLPGIDITATRGHFVRYAGASGDFNPIHWDETFATSAGYPSVFGMGMFTTGVAARLITDWAGAGSVRRLRVRFAAQVWPDEALRFRGTVSGISPEGTHVEIEVTNPDGEVKLTGTAIAAVT